MKMSSDKEIKSNNPSSKVPNKILRKPRAGRGYLGENTRMVPYLVFFFYFCTISEISSSN